LKAYKLTFGFINVKITWPDDLPAVQFSVWGSPVVWLIDMGWGEVDLKPGLKMPATGFRGWLMFSKQPSG
jgi:hypothetical protein